MNEIVGFEGRYSISEDGKVWSHGRKLFMKHQISNCGYARVELQGKKFSIHRLVAEAFLGKVKGKEYVNHKDGNKVNNHVDNLEWCTMSENVKHAFATGLKKPSWGTKIGTDSHFATLNDSIVRSIVLDSENLCQRELAEKYFTSKSTIKHILSGRSWKHITNGKINKINKRVHLTLDAARDIRRKYKEGATQMSLANEYCVGLSVIHKVVYNKTWKDPLTNDPQAS